MWIQYDDLEYWQIDSVHHESSGATINHALSPSPSSLPHSLRLTHHKNIQPSNQPYKFYVSSLIPIKRLPALVHPTSLHVRSTNQPITQSNQSDLTTITSELKLSDSLAECSSSPSSSSMTLKAPVKVSALFCTCASVWTFIFAFGFVVLAVVVVVLLNP